MKAGLCALTLGVGAAAGAVAVLMLPKQNAARKAMEKAAQKTEDVISGRVVHRLRFSGWFANFKRHGRKV